MRGKHKCKCCRHPLPHCRCRVDRTPPDPPKLIDTPAGKCQIDKYMSLIAAGFTIASRHGNQWLNIYQVSGAVRALDLKEDTSPCATTVHGAVIFRQTTMVRRSDLPKIEQYIVNKYYGGKPPKKGKKP